MAACLGTAKGSAGFGRDGRRWGALGEGLWVVCVGGGVCNQPGSLVTNATSVGERVAVLCRRAGNVSCVFTDRGYLLNSLKVLYRESKKALC